MPVTRTDGIIVYRYPDPVTEVTLNGVSMIDREVLEIWVDPENGEGMVLSRIGFDATKQPKKRWVSGEWRNYITTGKVVVTLS